MTALVSYENGQGLGRFGFRKGRHHRLYFRGTQPAPNMPRDTEVSRLSMAEFISNSAVSPPVVSNSVLMATLNFGHGE